jgi:hypothetical protein
MALSRRRLEFPDFVACLVVTSWSFFPFSFLYYFPGLETELDPLEFSSSLYRRSELPSRGDDSRRAAAGGLSFFVLFFFFSPGDSVRRGKC